MPGPHSHHEGPPWGGGSWVFHDPDAMRRGPSRALRLWVPVLLSALVQLIGALVVLRGGERPPDVVALTIAEYIPRQVIRLRRLFEGFPLLG